MAINQSGYGDTRSPDTRWRGINVLRKIKKQSPETVVVILTNYPYAAYRKHCTELGADFFFDKSTEFEKIKSIF